jgi:pentatricopeptide repeat protein
MGLVRRKSGYDRVRILKEGGEARAKKRRHKAIALYRQILVVEPDNPDIHERIAPLLAETKQEFEAWVSFRTMAGAYLRNGQFDKALAVYQEASRSLAREVDVWQAISKLHRKQGRDHEAMQALLEGRQQFRRAKHHAQAIYLLRRALEIQSWDCETVLDLARLLSKNRQSYEANRLLTGLAARVPSGLLRRVRAEQFRLNPTLANLWQLVRALVTEGPGAEITRIRDGEPGRPDLRLRRGGQSS